MKSVTPIATLAPLAVLAWMLLVVPHPARRTGPPVPGQAAHPRMPLTFVENRGQTDSHVRYFARGPHSAFFLTPTEVVISLAKAPRSPRFFVNAAYSNNAPPRQPAEGLALRLQFLHSNPAVTIAATDAAPREGNLPAG